jgi:hypothetical protein
MRNTDGVSKSVFIYSYRQIWSILHEENVDTVLCEVVTSNWHMTDIVVGLSSSLHYLHYADNMANQMFVSAKNNDINSSYVI